MSTPLVGRHEMTYEYWMDSVDKRYMDKTDVDRWQGALLLFAWFALNAPFFRSFHRRFQPLSLIRE
jgi:hypothetical protein